MTTFSVSINYQTVENKRGKARKMLKARSLVLLNDWFWAFFSKRSKKNYK